MNIFLRSLEKIASPETLIEVTDDMGSALLHMPWEHVLRQSLPCKLVVLIFSNTKGHIFLKKKPSADKRKKNTLWGLDITPVEANEAKKDAALRISQQAAGLHNLSPHELACLKVPSAPHMTITYFLARMPGDIPPMPANDAPLMLVDADEVEGLLETAPEVLAPEVHIIARTNTLFTPRADSPCKTHGSFQHTSLLE